jgi:hypothetical protein
VSEYAEELYDDDDLEDEFEGNGYDPDDVDELQERLAALEQRLEAEEDEDEDVEEINAELEEWARQSYSRSRGLDADSWQRMGELMDEHGLSAAEAHEALSGQNRVEDFAELASRIEAGEGRSLTESELHRLWEADQRAELTGEGGVDVKEVLHDLDSSDGRADFIAEKLAVPQEREEASAVTEDDTPSFNLDSPSERSEAIDRMLAGESPDTHDDTPMTGDE